MIDRKISQVMKWRLNGLELVKPYTECVSCIIFSYNYMYTCGEDAGILIWDLQTWRPLPHELELGRDTVSVCSCPSGRFLFGLLGCGTIVMWDSSNDFDLKILAEKTRSSIIALTHNGNFLVLASNDSVLRLIEIESGQEYEINTEENAKFASITLFEDEIITCMDNGAVILWNIARLTSSVVQGVTANMNSPCAFSPTGTYVAIVDKSEHVRVYRFPKFVKYASIRRDPPDTITCIRFTSNEKFMLYSLECMIIRIWSVATRQVYGNLQANAKIINFSISANEQFIAAALSNSSIYMWDFTEFLKVTVFEDRVDSASDRTVVSCILENSKVLKGHQYQVWGVAIDEAKAYTCGSDGLIKAWDLETMSERFTLSGHSSPVYRVILSKDCKSLYSASENGQVKGWNLDTRSEIFSLEHESAVYNLCISHDGRTLITAGVRVLIGWDLRTKTEYFVLKGHSAAIWGLAIHPNDKVIVSGSDSGEMFFWNLALWKIQHNHENEYKCIKSCAFSPNGKFVAFGSASQGVEVLDYPDLSRYMHFKECLHMIRSISFSSDNNFVMGAAEDSTIRIWSIPQKRQLVKINTGFKAYDVKVSLSQSYIICCLSKPLVHFWDMRKFLIAGFGDLSSEGSSRCCVKWDFREVVVLSQNKTILVWNLIDGTNRKAGFQSNSVVEIAVSKNSKIMLCGYKTGQIKAVDINQALELFTLGKHKAFIKAITISNDCKFALSSSLDKDVCLWNLTTRSLITGMVASTYPATCLAFNAASSVGFIGSRDNKIVQWDLLGTETIESIQLPQGDVECLAVASDDSFLAVGLNSGHISITNLLLEQFPPMNIESHTGKVHSLQFDSTNFVLVSAGGDLIIKIWDVRSGILIRSISGGAEKIGRILLCPDDSEIISYTLEGKIAKWRFRENTDIVTVSDTTPIEAYVCLNDLTKCCEPQAEYTNRTFGQSKFNYLHIFCHRERPEHCLASLEKGCPLELDAHGYSPLHYALTRKAQYCVDTILCYMITISDKERNKFIDYCHAICKDFYILIRNKSIHLHKFILCLHYKSRDRTLPSFGFPKQSLPYLYYSNDISIEVSNFLYTGVTWQNSEEISVEFKTTAIPLPYIIGSTESIKLLESLQNCSRPEILESDLIGSIVKLKWDALWPVILAQTILLWVNLVVMIYLVMADYSLIAAIAFISINAVLVLYEISQVLVYRMQYLKEAWNIVDMIRTGLCTLFLYYYFENKENSLENLDFSNTFTQVTWFMIVFNFCRGLTGFRAFDQTRFYLRLIFRAVTDTFAFLIIFFYSTLGFGVLYSVSTVINNRESEFYLLWKQPFELSMGNFSNDGDSVCEYAYFMFASVLNVIIMLNLLISLLGDSFEKFQLEATQVDRMEMIEAIIELEKMMFWRRDNNDMKHLQLCTYSGSQLSQFDWQGKIIKLEAKIEESSAKVIEFLKKQGEAKEKKQQRKEKMFASQFKALQAKIMDIDLKSSLSFELISGQLKSIQSKQRKESLQVQSISTTLRMRLGDAHSPIYVTEEDLQSYEGNQFTSENNESMHSYENRFRSPEYMASESSDEH